METSQPGHDRNPLVGMHAPTIHNQEAARLPSLHGHPVAGNHAQHLLEGGGPVYFRVTPHKWRHTESRDQRCAAQPNQAPLRTERSNNTGCPS